jgi:serine/threonine protein kinase
LNEIIHIATQICDALEAAHARKIIHRNITQDNIMITKEGFVKVMDFGLAKLKADEEEQESQESRKDNVFSTKVSFQTSVSSLLGTASYMSSQQIENKPIDEWTDIVSLGIVLYEMLTGTAPFEQDDSRPLGLSRAVVKNLDTDESQLYPPWYLYPGDWSPDGSRILFVNSPR